jgi:hypothetical protein
VSLWRSERALSSITSESPNRPDYSPYTPEGFWKPLDREVAYAEVGLKRRRRRMAQLPRPGPFSMHSLCPVLRNDSEVYQYLELPGAAYRPLIASRRRKSGDGGFTPLVRPWPDCQRATIKPGRLEA